MDELRQALDAIATGEAVVLATVVAVQGSAPRGPGARLLLRAGGKSTGSVGGGEVEAAVLKVARELLAGADPSTRLLEEGTECGGKMTVFIERLSPGRRLLVVGAGHVGRAIATLASQASFLVTVYDPTGEAAWVEGTAIGLVKSDDPAALDELEHPAATQVIVATGTHDADRRWAVAALERGFAGVGVIGSRKKAQSIARQAEAAGIAAERTATVRCPVGMPIGAVTPTEIAISAVSELIALSTGGVRPT